MSVGGSQCEKLEDKLRKGLVRQEGKVHKPGIVFDGFEIYKQYDEIVEKLCVFYFIVCYFIYSKVYDTSSHPLFRLEP